MTTLPTSALTFWKSGHRRWWWLLLGCSVVLMLAWWWLWPYATPAARGMWVSVQSQPEQRSVQADGYLEPVAVVQILAPFDGKVVKNYVQIGDKVKQGALLLEVERSDVLAEHREAEIAYTRASEALDELKNWQYTSTEVLNQKRQLQRSESTLENARGKLQETQQLYDKGIVARSELSGAQLEWANAQAELQAAQEAMQASLKKGSASQVRIVQLEYENRARKLAQIKQRLERAAVRAPADGVVLYPVTEYGAAPSKGFSAGGFVKGNEVLFSLGDVSMMKVATALDEVDIANVAMGMPVHITLGNDPDLVLQGELAHISAQAKRGSMQGMGMAVAPMFDIQVLVRDLPPSVRPRAKLGMTAHLLIEPKSQATVLSVPLASVVREGGASYVRVRDGERTVRRKVRLGKTLLEQVVVSEGLSADDMVWVEQAADSASPETGVRLPGLSSGYE